MAVPIMACPQWGLILFKRSLTITASRSSHLVSCRFYAKDSSSSSSQGTTTKSDKSEALAKKLRSKTPIGKLEELDEGRHPFQEKEPLKPHPGGVNPSTGEIGGPAGPEPTRYGDWERKGRVSDF